MNAIEIVAAGDSSLLVRFGRAIAPELHDRVLALFHAIRRQADSRIRNLHPGYASLLIDFDPLRMTHTEVAARVELLLQTANEKPMVPREPIAIPACYDAEFGPDLADVAAHNGISAEEVIALHSSAIYTVYFLGFSPGFGYLGGLPKELRTPRLASPRSRVPAGSVGIAGEQTAVYPSGTAGGWRLIGRTPLVMFDATSDSPSRLQPGDRVKFTAISRSAFERMGQCPEPYPQSWQ
jgi:KipI family sensor histidine kinase inhibitor